jgi:hypothetical protein
MNLKSIETFSPILKSIEPKELVFNKNNSDAIEFELPKNIDYTSPYWLNQKGTVGMYRVDEQNKIGIPDVIRQLEVTFNIEIEGVTISFERNIVFKTNDNVKGEIYQPLDIVPEITSSFAEKVYVFNNNRTKTIAVKIKSGKDNIAGKVRLEIPKNWEISPLENPFKMERKGEEQIVIFSVKPSKETSENVIKSIVTIDNQEFDKNKIDINYNHIFKQMVLKPAETKFLKLNIKTKNEKIAYIMGAGDEVPKSLQQMGYEVSIINPNEISTEKLSRFDVVMTGIRAYNVVNELKYKQDILLNFVKNGKTMIVQYNTTDALVTPNIAPFPLKIGKERVTEENAEVRFIDQKNEILNFPNKLTIKDFEGWTQEQGLNYPSEFDNNFVSIISSNDKGETPKNSAILVAKYGKGTYIYTGISFFRQLPEGVSGAFRLMSNLISVKN